MSNVFALDPDGELYYTFNFTDQIPSTSPLTTIASMSYVITPTYSPQTLRVDEQTDNLASFLSSVRLVGAVLGETYQVTAYALLTNGESVPQNIVVRGFK